MKTQNIYTLFLCFFCLFYNINAQEITIQEINDRINNTSQSESVQIKYLAYGAPNSIFVNAENGPSKFLRNNQSVDEINAKGSNDVSTLSQFYTNDLDKVQIITINLGHQEPPTLSEETLSKLPDLKYVYIRSEQKLSKNTIENKFKDLIALLTTKRNDVIILYESLSGSH